MFSRALYAFLVAGRIGAYGSGTYDLLGRSGISDSAHVRRVAAGKYCNMASVSGRLIRRFLRGSLSARRRHNEQTWCVDQRRSGRSPVRAYPKQDFIIQRGCAGSGERGSVASGERGRRDGAAIAKRPESATIRPQRRRCQRAPARRPFSLATPPMPWTIGLHAV